MEASRRRFAGDGFGATLKGEENAAGTDTGPASWRKRRGTAYSFCVRARAGGMRPADGAVMGLPEYTWVTLEYTGTKTVSRKTIRQTLKKAKSLLTSPKKGGSIKEALDDAFFHERKDAALWAKTPKEAADVLRGVCGEVWQNATPAQRKAAYGYTSGSDWFTSLLSKNSPSMRGYDGSWYGFKGIGKVDLNAESGSARLKN